MAHGYVAIQHGFAWGVLGRGRSSRKWDQRGGFASWLHRSFCLIHCRFHGIGNGMHWNLLLKGCINHWICALIGEHISQIKVYVRLFFPNCLDCGLNWQTLEEQMELLPHVCFEHDFVGGLAWRMQPFGWLKRGLQTAFPEAGIIGSEFMSGGMECEWLKASCCIVKGISPPVVFRSL